MSTDLTNRRETHGSAVVEVGVSIYDNQMLVYEPPGNLKTTAENITVGFFTRIKEGVIMQLTSSMQVI